MAPQPVPQQPNMSWDQILPYFATINNRKGSMNADISTLFDPQFGIMSNSSAQQSPEELFNMYAPQSMSLANSSDQTIMDILADFENGKSPFEIKQAIRNGVNSGAIVSSDGEGKDYLDVVDVIFAEQQMVKTKLDDQNKVYRDAGLPTPDQRFDPQSYMPEQFKAIDDKVAANRPKVDAALAAIKSKYDSMPPAAANPSIRTEEEESAIKRTGSKYGLSPKQILEQKSPQAVAAYKTYLKMVEQNPPKSQTEIEYSALRRTGSKFGLSPRTILAQDGPQAKAAYKTYLKMVEADKPKVNTIIRSKEQQIRDSNRQLEIERAGGEAKQIISPNSTNQQPVYNPYSEKDQATRMKQLISQKISQGLDQRGETPTNVALLQRILLNQNSKG